MKTVVTTLVIFLMTSVAYSADLSCFSIIKRKTANSNVYDYFDAYKFDILEVEGGQKGEGTLVLRGFEAPEDTPNALEIPVKAEKTGSQGGTVSGSAEKDGTEYSITLDLKRNALGSPYIVGGMLEMETSLDSSSGTGSFVCERK